MEQLNALIAKYEENTRQGHEIVAETAEHLKTLKVGTIIEFDGSMFSLGWRIKLDEFENSRMWIYDGYSAVMCSESDESQMKMTATRLLLGTAKVVNNNG